MRTPARILIADDDPMSLDIFATRLKANGYEILTAEDGDAAWELTKTHQPDLVLLDIMMPKRDGMEVCRLIKKDATLSFTPVIIVTAKTGTGDLVSGLEAGADEYLTKPVDHAALVARVQSMLRIKELQDKTKEQASQLEVQAAQLEEWNKELQVQLWEEAKLAEIARLLGDIGHDMKNLLTPVLSGVELLRDVTKDIFGTMSHAELTQHKTNKEICDSSVEVAQNGIRRLHERVKQMADCVKGRSSPPNFSSCRLEAVIHEVFQTLLVSAKEKHIALRTEGLESLPVIQADERRLYNAFYNLVNNAIPETQEGTITIRAHADSESREVVLSVVDTGRGMPADIRDSLFTSKVISRKVGGTGLGTKIVKDVVDAHNGRISVQSELGVGTIFRVRLPLDPTCAKPSASP